MNCQAYPVVSYWILPARVSIHEREGARPSPQQTLANTANELHTNTILHPSRLLSTHAKPLCALRIRLGRTALGGTDSGRLPNSETGHSYVRETGNAHRLSTLRLRPRGAVHQRVGCSLQPN